MSVDPLTVSIASTVISGAFSAASSIQQGRAAKAQAAYQAGVARNNQIIAQRMADDARERGKIEAGHQRTRTQQLIGRQRAVMASNGVLVDQDSALDVTSDTAEFGKLDELTIRSNAEREALGFETQGMNFESEARLHQLTGRNAASAARSEAFGTLLNTGALVADKWYRHKKGS